MRTASLAAPSPYSIVRIYPYRKLQPIISPGRSSGDSFSGAAWGIEFFAIARVPRISKESMILPLGLQPIEQKSAEAEDRRVEIVLTLGGTKVDTLLRMTNDILS